MSTVIVDRLEVIDIEQDQAKWQRLALMILEFDLEPCEEGPAVVGIGEMIAIGQFLQMLVAEREHLLGAHEVQQWKAECLCQRIHEVYEDGGGVEQFRSDLNRVARSMARSRSSPDISSAVSAPARPALLTRCGGHWGVQHSARQSGGSGDGERGCRRHGCRRQVSTDGFTASPERRYATRSGRTKPKTDLRLRIAAPTLRDRSWPLPGVQQESGRSLRVRVRTRPTADITVKHDQAHAA